MTINGKDTTYDIKEYMVLTDTTFIVPDTTSQTGYRDSLVILTDTLVKHTLMTISPKDTFRIDTSKTPYDTIPYVKMDTVRNYPLNIVDNIRKDKKFYKNKEQLGLQTFRNWAIAEDKNGDDERYNFMSSKSRDGDNGSGDKRFMMATGPFNMLPGDTARVVVGMILASPGVRDEADGSTADLVELVKKTSLLKPYMMITSVLHSRLIELSLQNGHH